MNKFNQFGIKANLSKTFTGDKIKISKILNKEITVLAYKTEDSKFAGKGKCLYMQIEYKEEKHVLFTGSITMLEMIQRVPAEGFPFTTTIIEVNEYYEFS